MPLMHRELVVALACGGAALALWASLRRLRRDRLLADTPSVRLRSAAQGYVKVSGRALPAHFEPTRAPLSGRPCVWWSYEIAHDESTQPQRREWRTMEKAASVELFMLVDDDDARCLVGPVEAEITPTVSNTWYGEEARPAGPPPPAPVAVFFGSWRYTERLLGVGARVSVVGELRSHSETGDVDHATQQKLRAWKQDPAMLLARFDANHDGRIDQAEWDAARAAARAEAAAQVMSAHVERVSVIAQPVNGEPFLVAPLSPAQLVRRERAFATLYFALGLACVWLCAWALRQPP